MKKRKNDLILAAIVIVLAALLWFGVRLTQREGAYVVVTVDGELFGQYPLDTNTEVRIGDEDKYNLLVIKDGEAQFVKASCPDKLCVNQGKISFDGQSIICLPNKAVAEIKGGEQSDYDAVAK